MRLARALFGGLLLLATCPVGGAFARPPAAAQVLDVAERRPLLADSAAGTLAPTVASSGSDRASPGRSTPASPRAGWIASPTPDGVAPIASSLRVQAYLEPAWGTGAIPGPDAPGVEGAERFLCAPSHNSYDDPVVYPGQPGRSHLHNFFGNTKADAFSTYQSLRTTGDSTCNTVLNRSAYWIPAMMNAGGKVVMPDYVSIYYKRAPQGSRFCGQPWAERCAQLPRGLRYIFGYNMIDPSRDDPSTQRWFNCDGPGAISGHFRTIAEASRGCPAGARLGAIIAGPQCWDGKHLDSPDHRSHMTYQAQDGYGRAVCPRSHPVMLPMFELGAWYRFDGGAWRLASDIQMGTEAGTTFHADWFGAWEDSILTRWTAHCIDRALSCSGGDLGDGSQQRQLPAAIEARPRVVNPPPPPPGEHMGHAAPAS